MYCDKHALVGGQPAVVQEVGRGGLLLCKKPSQSGSVVVQGSVGRQQREGVGAALPWCSRVGKQGLCGACRRAVCMGLNEMEAVCMGQVLSVSELRCGWVCRDSLVVSTRANFVNASFTRTGCSLWIGIT